MRLFGWNVAVGKRIRFASAPDSPPLGTVIGVVQDFHFMPLHRAIGPLVITPGFFGYAAIKVRAQNLAATLAFIEATWKEIEPDKSFIYSFLDDILNQNYETEDRLSQLTTYFSGLAIFIACLGLLGLVSFAAARRTKEIGIRKVLGATVANLVRLLSQEFLKLVLIANVLAWPIAYVAMSIWLENFAYRITPSGWTFLIAGAAAVVIALLTVSYQAIRAALANPVEALRYE
jgi:putative ABC transport system permease protein